LQSGKATRQQSPDDYSMLTKEKIEFGSDPETG
jgi:hypothetical protein